MNISWKRHCPRPVCPLPAKERKFLFHTSWKEQALQLETRKQFYHSSGGNAQGFLRDKRPSSNSFGWAFCLTSYLVDKWGNHNASVMVWCQHFLLAWGGGGGSHTEMVWWRFGLFEAKWRVNFWAEVICVRLISRGSRSRKVPAQWPKLKDFFSTRT